MLASTPVAMPPAMAPLPFAFGMPGAMLPPMGFHPMFMPPMMMPVSLPMPGPLAPLPLLSNQALPLPLRSLVPVPSASAPVPVPRVTVMAPAPPAAPASPPAKTSIGSVASSSSSAGSEAHETVSEADPAELTDVFRGRAATCYQVNGRWADDLLDLKTRALNRLLKLTSFSDAEIKDLKKARRRKV